MRSRPPVPEVVPLSDTAFTGSFLHGLVLAFALILPLGPQNTFVLAQASTLPRLRDAAPVALTAALCDTALITMSVGGVSVLVLAVPWFRTGVALAGSLFMLLIAVTTWPHSRPARPQSPVRERARTRSRTAFSTPWARVRHSISVSLLNPHAILDTLGVIGAASTLEHTVPLRVAYAIGACLVSWVWFGTLLGVGHTLSRTLREGSPQALWAGRISAMLMAGLALRLLLTTLPTLRIGLA